MTNAEKFKRIFGYEIKKDINFCLFVECDCIENCINCPMMDWEKQKYQKPAAETKVIKGEREDDNSQSISIKKEHKISSEN